jgi:hypothetical protein
LTPKLRPPDKQLWSAQTTGELSPGDEIALSERNDELANVSGSYPLDEKVQVVASLAGRQWVEEIAIRDVPQSGVLYQGKRMAVDEYWALIAQECQTETASTSK